MESQILKQRYPDTARLFCSFKGMITIAEDIRSNIQCVDDVYCEYYGSLRVVATHNDDSYKITVKGDENDIYPEFANVIESYLN